MQRTVYSSWKDLGMAPSKECRTTVLLFALICAAGFCTPGQCANFAGGTGEPNDPYQIATADQLRAVDSVWEPELRQKHYVLTADIDLSGKTRSTPVVDIFGGVFDGNGHTIRNLRIISDGNQGLFGLIEPGAEVRNLGVADVYVRSGNGPGGLVSQNLGTVHNCYSTGEIIGLYDRVGGLIGWNFGRVTHSYSTASVTGRNSVGGLAGTNVGEVSWCYSAGAVTGDGHVGGLVGQNMAEITSSYSLAVVTVAFTQAGGLAGVNMGRITSCYTDIVVVGYDWYVGGLVGDNLGTVSSCYSTGSVTGEDRVGGLVGFNGGAVATSYSVANVADHGYSQHMGALVGSGKTPNNDYFLAPPDGSGPDNGLGTPLTSAEMKEQSSFEGWDFWGIKEDGTADVWFMPVNDYPVLAWQTELTGLLRIPDVAGLTLEQAQEALLDAGFVPGDTSFDYHRSIPEGQVIHTVPQLLAPAGATVDMVLSLGATYEWSANAGDGTPANPYQIETPGQLESLAGHPELWSRYFVLTADVDMIGRSYEKALIAPDTDDSTTGFQGTAFSGAFDGQGHGIHGLTIRRIDVRHDYVGLFGMVAPSGRISSLNLFGADVEGGSGSNSYIGVLAGYNAGTISGCTVTGIIRGGKGDGLVGANTGALTDCQANIARR